MGIPILVKQRILTLLFFQAMIIHVLFQLLSKEIKSVIFGCTFFMSFTSTIPSVEAFSNVQLFCCFYSKQ